MDPAFAFSDLTRTLPKAKLPAAEMATLPASSDTFPPKRLPALVNATALDALFSVVVPATSSAPVWERSTELLKARFPLTTPPILATSLAALPSVASPVTASSSPLLASSLPALWLTPLSPESWMRSASTSPEICSPPPTASAESSCVASTTPPRLIAAAASAGSNLACSTTPPAVMKPVLLTAAEVPTGKLLVAAPNSAVRPSSGSYWRVTPPADSRFTVLPAIEPLLETDAPINTTGPLLVICAPAAVLTLAAAPVWSN